MVVPSQGTLHCHLHYLLVFVYGYFALPESLWVFASLQELLIESWFLQLQLFFFMVLPSVIVVVVTKILSSNSSRLFGGLLI